MEIIKLLTEDIESGKMEYVSTESLKQLYTKVTGKNQISTNIMLLDGMNQAIQSLRTCIRMG